MMAGLQTLADDPGGDVDLWSVFHENSKTSRLEPSARNDEVLVRMAQLRDALSYEGYDRVALPEVMPSFDLPLGDAILKRISAREIAPASMSIEQIATMLHAAYGITRSNEDGPFPRPFRSVPSGGALYPLEIYIHTSCVEGLAAGLHHFNPREHALRLLQPGDRAREIGAALVQSHLATSVSALIFVTALFERSIFKYGNRGYRFILLEAGHVAQNINIVSTALGLGCINIGGFFDRDIDRFLGLDGIRHSTVYLIGIGRDAPRPST